MPLGSSARRWTPLAAGAAVATVALTLSGMSPALAGQDHFRHAAGGHRLDHVFIIMEENHAPDGADNGTGIGLLDDSRNMPFLNSLADHYGVATTYYGVTHPSEPNYIAATSGSTWGANDDDGWYSGTGGPDPAVNGNHYPHRNIVDQLEANRIPWAAYMQSMPTAGYLPDNYPESGSDPLYQSKHNPFILYNDIRDSSARRDQIKPYEQMKADLNGRHVPRYVWITPDLCHDLHGTVHTCPYGDANHPYTDPNEAKLRQDADAFLKEAVSTIKHSKAWTGNSVIFVVADEGDFDAAFPTQGDWEDASGCCDSPYLPPGDPDVSADWPGGVYGGGYAPMVVVTSHGPHGATDATPANHYSMLRTIEDGFGLAKLGYAGDTEQVPTLWPLIARR